METLGNLLGVFLPVVLAVAATALRQDMMLCHPAAIFSPLLFGSQELVLLSV